MTVVHDEDRCALIYMRCKSESVGYARQLLASAGSQNRYLCAFDAEELYDTAWETYYARGEYLDETDDHIARINAVILSRFRDERRRSKAQKRTLPGRPVDLTAGNHPAAPGRRLEDRVVDRDELRQRLALIRNPEDRQALIDHDLHGLTFEEIAEQAGITAEAARRRAQRARNQAAETVGSGPGSVHHSGHAQGQNGDEQGELW